MKNKKINKYVFIPIATAVVSILMLVILKFNNIYSNSKSYLQFLDDVKTNKISTVYLTPSPKIQVKLKDGSTYETDNPRTGDFKELILKQGIQVSEGGPASPLIMFPSMTLIASIFAILFMSIKNSAKVSKKLLSVDHMETETIQNIGLTFESVAGNEEAKESVKDIVDFLKNPEKYNAYGARMPKGVILYGEPGTGKTLLAKAVAGEAGVPFYALSGSDFVQVYVGVGASRIRQLFKKARSHGKAVIFIDEIDAIGKKRDGGKNTGGSDERDQTLNALLTEMSGFNEKEGIVVMAATNRLDILDDALLRPGRFDRHIEINLPDVSAREKILTLHFKNKPVEDINIKEWAQKTAYFSGAKLESLVNEAAILACKDNSPYIKDLHLDKAYSIVLAGYEKQNRDYITETDRKITAFHEVGHALVSLKQLPKEKVSKVTIIPSTKGAGGYTLSIPEDKLYQSKDYLKRRIMVLLGGRAAEEIIFGENYITTGAYNDLQKSTDIAMNMVARYGMGESLGLLNLDSIGGNANASELVKECRNIINNLYEETKELLIQNKELLEKIASKLLDEETLYDQDLQKLLWEKAA